MMKLTRTLQMQGDEAFAAMLKAELADWAGMLPLHQSTSEGGYSDATDLQVTVLGINQDDQMLYARIGVFFTEIVANCSCGDEPVHKPAYCLMQLSIDRATGAATANVLAD